MEKLQIFKNSKIIGMILSVVLVMVSALGVTMAIYSAESNVVVNQFSFGNITTELVEEFYQKENTENKTEFVKTPKVTNSGANSCLVRVRVSITPQSVVDRDVTIGKETKPYLQIYDIMNQEWRYNDDENPWSNNWWEYKDGWYYYKGVLEPEESTKPLFSNVVVNYDQNDEWENFDIILYHEAVQAEVIENGEIISATNQNGNYLASNADRIWKLYEAALTNTETQE